MVVDEPVGAPRGVLLLGHGAGGDHTSPVLAAAAVAGPADGLVVARFDQPYRLAGRRAPDPPAKLDAAALAVVAEIRQRYPGVPLVVGGKSSGARVACRISADSGAVGVVCLGFPLHPPGRPEKSRAAELAAVEVPALVLQGERDTFGSPADVRAAVPASRVTVHAIRAGDHSFAPRRSDGRTLKECLDEVVAVTLAWVGAL